MSVDGDRLAELKQKYRTGGGGDGPLEARVWPGNGLRILTKALQDCRSAAGRPGKEAEQGEAGRVARTTIRRQAAVRRLLQATIGLPPAQPEFASLVAASRGAQEPPPASTTPKTKKKKKTDKLNASATNSNGHANLSAEDAAAPRQPPSPGSHQGSAAEGEESADGKPAKKKKKKKKADKAGVAAAAEQAVGLPPSLGFSTTSANGTLRLQSSELKEAQSSIAERLSNAAKEITREGRTCLRSLPAAATSSQPLAPWLSSVEAAVLLGSEHAVYHLPASEVAGIVNALQHTTNEVVKALWKRSQAAHEVTESFLSLPDALLRVRDSFAASLGLISSPFATCAAALPQTLLRCIARVDNAVAMSSRRAVESQIQFLRMTSFAAWQGDSFWRSYSVYNSGNPRCSQPAAFTLLHLRRFVNAIGQHPCTAELISRVVASTTAAYLDITPSEARAKQLKLDALYFSRGIRQLEKYYDWSVVEPSPSPEVVAPATRHVDACLLDLLLFAILLDSPLGQLIALLKPVILLKPDTKDIERDTVPDAIWSPRPFVRHTRGMALVDQPDDTIAAAEFSLAKLVRESSLNRTHVCDVLKRRWELWDSSPVVPAEEQHLVFELRTAILSLEQDVTSESGWEAIRASFEVSGGAAAAGDDPLPLSPLDSDDEQVSDPSSPPSPAEKAIIEGD
ncbi:hypothetical protein DIPPA_27022 [Diplonema papillatum]|nr:hypothetical protein DIPPA_27022 [Diplonema papillatum]